MSCGTRSYGLATLTPMYSKVAYEARKSRLAALRRLTPEQRRAARMRHRQLMMELYEAGRQIRERRRAGGEPKKELDQ